MIDLGAGVGMAVSEWWTVPAVSVSAGWRPQSSVEVQVSGFAGASPLGGYTAAGREISRCFCDGMVGRVDAGAGVAVGVFPLREQVGRWEIEAGVRVGGAVVNVRPGEYIAWGDDVWTSEKDPFLAPGWTVEAVASAGIGRFGGRLRLEQVSWYTLAEGVGDRTLLPRVEGYVRW